MELPRFLRRKPAVNYGKGPIPLGAPQDHTDRDSAAVTSNDLLRVLLAQNAARESFAVSVAQTEREIAAQETIFGGTGVYREIEQYGYGSVANEYKISEYRGWPKHNPIAIGNRIYAVGYLFKNITDTDLDIAILNLRGQLPLGQSPRFLIAKVIPTQAKYEIMERFPLI